MILTQEMIDNCLNTINNVYGYKVKENDLYLNYWNRVFFSQALVDLYGIELFGLPSPNDIKKWKNTGLRKEKLKKIMEK